ncbi:MAG TPA: ribose 5-phosphate isomerase B [Candidatus Hydrogenedentes bacterium]|nr:ribose 5-phosphate isomerase B [Candidatus Hydrogenedentota bacterium]HOJ68234.1 ribose 5-phosphate isomerase B [Candidatus Hydrogenedentota bacterium]HOV59658.1 ribose 5-phosphate isomerase B [Candidatus Hydrogenedentota bacterium]
MILAVGCDHAGYEPPDGGYVPAIIAFLDREGHQVIHCGTRSAESVDYPDFAARVCQRILSGDAERGILVCGTGIGMSIAANRYHGIRAAVCVNEEMARLAREHNDANVLCMGRRTMTLDTCLRVLKVWLETPFSGGERHRRRVEKLDRLDVDPPRCDSDCPCL